MTGRLRDSGHMAYERVSLKQAADMLGISKKAVEQAIQRDAFPNIERVPNPNKSGHVLRVWIPKSDVEAYAASRGIALGDAPAPPPDSQRRPRRREAFLGISLACAREQTVLRRPADDLAGTGRGAVSGDLELKARVRELEQRLARRGS